MTPSPAETIRHWVELLCRDLALVRDRAAAGGQSSASALAALVEAAAAGRADAAWVTELVELLRGLGIPAAQAHRGWPFSDRAVGGLPGLDDGSPAMDRYVCPQQICSRREVRRPGGSVPRCAIVGASLAVHEDDR